MIRSFICHNCHYHLGPFRESVKSDIPVFCPQCHRLMDRDKAVEMAYRNSNREENDEI